MTSQQLNPEEADLITHYRQFNTQYWRYQSRHGVKKWLKTRHQIENFWVQEAMRRKRKPHDSSVINAVRRRFCEAPNADPDIRGIAFMVSLEFWQKPGLVHLIKFRNGWTERPWPLRNPDRSMARPRRRPR